MLADNGKYEKYYDYDNVRYDECKAFVEKIFDFAEEHEMTVNDLKQAIRLAERKLDKQTGIAMVQVIRKATDRQPLSKWG